MVRRSARHVTLNQRVLGSSPSASTTLLRELLVIGTLNPETSAVPHPIGMQVAGCRLSAPSSGKPPRPEWPEGFGVTGPKGHHAHHHVAYKATSMATTPTAATLKLAAVA